MSTYIPSNLGSSDGYKYIGRCSDISTLRTIEPTTSGQKIEVVAYYPGWAITIAPVGGGEFYYDAADTTSTDNGGTVIVTVGGKRWKRSNVVKINPDWFGVKCDGVSDDTIPFQNAINAAGTGKIVLKQDTTYLVGNLNITSSVYFEGAGKRSESYIKPYPGTVGNMFTVSAAASPTFDGCRLVGDWTTTGSIYSPTPPTTGQLNCIYLTAASQYATSLQFINSTISNFSGYGVYAGVKRNMGFLNYSSVLWCWKSCLYLESAVDWMLFSSSIGRSNEDNIYANCGSFRMINSESYEGRENGIVFGPTATITSMVRNHVNSCGKNGILFNTPGGSEIHEILATTFFANGWRSSADTLLTDAYANIKLTASIRKIVTSNSHFNYSSDSNYTRVAYCMAFQSGSTTIWDGEKDIFTSSVATGSLGDSAAVAITSNPNRSNYTFNEVRYLDAIQPIQQAATSTTQVRYSVKYTSENYARLNITPNGIYGGGGTADPLPMLTWGTGKLYLNYLSGVNITYTEITSGYTFPTTGLSNLYYSVASSASTFTLPDASGLSSGFMIRVKKVLAAPTYTIQTSNAQTIYGPGGSGLTSVSITDVGIYEFMWNSARGCWIF